MTVVEGDLKAPFSIATTQRCREGNYFIPWIAPLYPGRLFNPISFFMHIITSKVGDRSRGWPKAPFAIATTPRWIGGRYSIPWIAPLYPGMLFNPISIFIHKRTSKVGDRSQGWTYGTLFSSSDTKVYRRALPHSLDCSILLSWVT